MSIEASTRAWKSGVGGSELLVLLALADFAGGHDDPYDHAYPSIGRIAEMCAVSKRTVQRSLRILEKEGVIRRTGVHEWRPGIATNVYRVEGRQSVTPDTEGRRGVTQVTPNPSLTHPSDLTTSVIAEVEVQEPQAVVARASNDEVNALFAFWQEATRHPQAKLTDDRRRKLKARLDEGYTVEQIRQAIRGAAVAPFVDDRGKRYDDLELICRNGTKLESFIDRADPTPVSPMVDRLTAQAERLAVSE